jgi:hypothetical protein
MLGHHVVKTLNKRIVEKEGKERKGKDIKVLVCVCSH